MIRKLFYIERHLSNINFCFILFIFTQTVWPVRSNKLSNEKVHDYSLEGSTFSRVTIKNMELLQQVKFQPKVQSLHEGKNCKSSTEDLERFLYDSSLIQEFNLEPALGRDLVPQKKKRSRRSEKDLKHSNGYNSIMESRKSVRKCYVEVRIALLLPLDNRRMFSIQKVLPAIQQALSSSTVKEILPDCRFTIYLANSQCSSVYAPLEAFNLLAIEKVHLFLGPVCDYSLGPVARYASYWDTPVISPGGMATDFSVGRTEPGAPFSMLTRIGMTFDGLAHIIHHVIWRYNWNHVKILYSTKGQEEIMNMFCFLAMSAVMRLLKNKDIAFSSFVFERTEEEDDITEMLKREVGIDHAIVILCNSPAAVRNVMIRAAELNFTKGDYIFFNVDPISSEDRTLQPWYRDWDSDYRNARARQAYEYVKIIKLREPHTVEYEEFSRQVIQRAKWKFNETVFNESSTHQQQVNSFVVAFHDAVILYAEALNVTLEAGLGPDNGTHLTLLMRNRTFRGIRGPITISNGDRANDFSLLDMDPRTGLFEAVADYYGYKGVFEPRTGKYIRWGNGRLGPPSDIPKCGYDNSKCPNFSLTEILPDVLIVILSCGMIILGLVCIVVFMLRRYYEKLELSETYWRIKWDDITLGFPEKKSQRKFKSATKGSLVAVKKLSRVITISHSLMSEIKEVMNLQHDNIVRFIGLCTDEPNQCIITEYCHKGSLQDVLKNEEFYLDSLFRFSLIYDIVRGMEYLHASNLHSHGNLKSSNCLVNVRFVVKLTDFGLESLRDKCNDRHFMIEKYSMCEECCKESIWTSPELLRMATRPFRGTQSGDVYSFAIICQEVIYNHGPFWIENSSLTIIEIIDKLKAGNKPYCRPTLKPQQDVGKNDRSNEAQRDGIKDEQLVGIIDDINLCWSEDPNLRPTFQYLSQAFLLHQTANNTVGDTGRSIVDSLLSRMEKYANNLESVVEERTAKYLEQRKRAEYLLNEMIPRSAADQLLRGEMVQPEKFDCVTVYFSDICGFTSLSATSSPMQVVGMLNELYTSFDAIVDGYDVYKVETIGDAYMVASGLSHNQSEHLNSSRQNFTQWKALQKTSLHKRQNHTSRHSGHHSSGPRTRKDSVSNHGLSRSRPVDERDRHAYHAGEIASMSLVLRCYVQNFRIRHKPTEQLKIRIGIHSGFCCGGIVGLKMPRYCLLGETINTASELQSTGEPLMIHVSTETKELLDICDSFELEKRGSVYISGKGDIETWWLNSGKSKE